MTIKVIKGTEADKIKIKDSLKRYTLNFTDIINNNNKFYNIEIVKDSKDKYFLHSQYGRVGTPSIQKEYRQCDDQFHAETEIEKIVKSKIKKGYTEVKLLKAEIGSEIGKTKVEESVISEKDAKKLGYKIEETSCSLHPEIQNVVKVWFGSIEQFVINTLDTSKCALGQLSLDQINKGRDLLLEARKIVAAGAKDITELNSISSKYYSNIPMNFGHKRLDADQLRFDNNDKLDTAFDILDTLENAKDTEKVLTKKSGIEEKYKLLNTGMEWIDPKSDIGKWIDALFHKTRAGNHSYLGKLKITNIFSLERKKEQEEYLKMAEKISKQNVKHVVPDMYKSVWETRPKNEIDYEKLMRASNILPLWHGSRTENFQKILSSKLLLRRPGFSVSGSMFDASGALYFANSSGKSCGYASISNAVWSKGNDKKAYLFLSDVCLGNSEIAYRAHPYTIEKIKPNMSVWAKAGQHLYNDEYMVYTTSQNWLRYVVEFEGQ